MSARSDGTELAINGGTPVRPVGREWPKWPIPADGVARSLEAVLESGRWAITSSGASALFERRFASKFKDYVGTQHCIPVDHGSSALVVALEALDYSYGDCILVPALTWTASASAVMRAGLVPMLVDVDEASGCMCVDHLEFGADPRAAIAVHWASGMADVPSLTGAMASRGMSVIEDCAQAHGAEWECQRAGALGRLGCFSMQNSKVLTAGEGGAVVTDDGALAERIEELRADSRRYRAERNDSMLLEVEESASVMGANFCMSEFNAAILLAQLDELDRQHAVRNANFGALAELVEGLAGVRLLMADPHQTQQSIYEATVVVDPLPEGVTNFEFARALTAELGVHVSAVDDPLYRSRLLRPWTKSTLKPLTERFLSLNRGRRFPNSEYFAQHGVQIHHSAFLGDRQDMVDIADALEKVVRAYTCPS